MRNGGRTRRAQSAAADSAPTEVKGARGQDHEAPRGNASGLIPKSRDPSYRGWRRMQTSRMTLLGEGAVRRGGQRPYEGNRGPFVADSSGSASLTDADLTNRAVCSKVLRG